MTKQELESTIKELREQIDELKRGRNPRGPSVVVFPSRKRPGEGGFREVPEDEREELISAMEEAQEALDDGRLDVAQRVLDRILDELLIPMKVVSDSDLIPVTYSDAMPVVFGAKRRWRSYSA